MVGPAKVLRVNSNNVKIIHNGCDKSSSLNRVHTVRSGDRSLESTANRGVSPDPVPLPIDADDKDEGTVTPHTSDVVPDEDAEDIITVAPRTLDVAQANPYSLPGPPDMASVVTNNEGQNTVLQANTDSFPGPPDIAS